VAQRTDSIGKAGIRRQRVNESEDLTGRRLTPAPVQPRSDLQPTSAPERTSQAGGTVGDPKDAAWLDLEALVELLLELGHTARHHPLSVG
jgi:hypothetical protein